MTNPIYTILITTYECHGMGVRYAVQNLKSIFEQTYRPLQVVVSDHSKDDEIEQAVRALDPKGVDFTYVRYTEHYGNPCANWTNALQYAKGSLINYFAMDDYLHHPTAVEEVVAWFRENPDVNWMVSRYAITPGSEIATPSWPPNILALNSNWVGGPSGVVIREAVRSIQLNPEFVWLLDVDWYYRLFLSLGKPAFSGIIYYTNRLSPYQLTNTVCTDEVQAEEYRRLWLKTGYQ